MRPTKTLLGFDDKWLVIAGVPFVSLLVALLLFHRQVEENASILLRCYPISIIYTTIFWLAMRGVVLYCRNKYFDISQTVRRLLIQSVFLIIAYVVIQFLMDLLLSDYLHVIFPHEKDPKGLGMTISSLTVSFLVVAIYEGIFFYTKYQQSLLEQERLKKEQIASQLEGLRNQVNPHFLFNSMNTLAQLIPENSDRAVKFVEKLSKVYRYILEIKDKELVTLSEEMTFLRAYLFLLKERFEDNLQVSIIIPDHYLQKKVLPLSLQLLIENAIKHNITSQEQPLSINIQIKENKLFVENKLQRKNQVMHSTKTGLENIKSRYSFFTKVLVSIKETSEHFSVALPLID